MYMFDISRKKNKYGRLSFEKQEYRTENTLGYKINKIFNMDLPLSDSNISIEHTFAERPNFIMHDLDDYETTYVTIRIGKEDFKFFNDRGPSDYNSYNYPKQRTFDYDNLVRAVVTYAYLKKHINQVVLDGKTKKDFKNMSTKELESLVSKKDKTMSALKEAIKTLIRGEKTKDTQEIVDENLGKEKINVDELVEKNVDKTLQVAEKKEDKKIKIEKFFDTITSAKKSVLDKVLKITKPIRMAVNNGKEKIKIKKEKNRIVKQEKKYRNNLMEDLRENS